MKLIIKSFLFIFFLSQVLLGNNKKYISTMGMEIKLSGSESRFKEFTYYKIDSVAKKDTFLSLLNQSSQDSMLFMINQILSVRDYEKELCYVLVSPATKYYTIEQPYYIKGTKNMYYQIVMRKKEAEQTYIYIRFYIVDKEKDRFKKIIINNNKKIELVEKELRIIDTVEYKQYGFKLTVKNSWRKLYDGLIRENNQYMIAYNMPRIWSEKDKNFIENNVMIIIDKIKDNKSIDDKMADLENNMKEIIKKEVITSKFGKAYKYKIKNKGHVYISQFDFVVKNDHLFKIVFTATPGTFNTNIEKYKEFLDNIVFTD